MPRQDKFKEMMLDEIEAALILAEGNPRGISADMIYEYLNEAGHFRGGRGPTAEHGITDGFVAEMKK